MQNYEIKCYGKISDKLKIQGETSYLWAYMAKAIPQSAYIGRKNFQIHLISWKTTLPLILISWKDQTY